MYKPYDETSEDDSDDEQILYGRPNPHRGRVSSSDDSDSSSDSDSGSGSETDGTTVSQRIRQDGRMQALDMWRKDALAWINGPGRNPVVEGPGVEATPLGLHNSKTNYVQQRVQHVLMVDSLDRDQRTYPLPTQLKLKLPRVYRNVERIDIVQVKMMSGFYAFTAQKGNTTVWINDVAYTIPDGSYTVAQLTTAINTTIGVSGVSVTFSATTGRFTFANGGGAAFTVSYKASTAPDVVGVYSEWGLLWNLGFGGAPAIYSGANTYTGSTVPRLVEDYIFLRMNDTEHMNTVDHTDTEDIAVAQDSTGQVSHYFGKLLLNNFGCYAQTFIESPKEFHPILGKLDRLSFSWCDRNGNVLAGADAASCDWHMTLRITEVQDRSVSDESQVRGVHTFLSNTGR